MRGSQDNETQPPQLGDRYDVVAELVAHDDAKTYIARRREDGAEVLVAVHRNPKGSETDALSLFAADTQVLRAEGHRALLPILDTHWVGDAFVVATERVVAPTLAELLERGERFSNYRIAGILRELNGLLEWAREHRIVHRAVTADTLFVEPGTDRVLAWFEVRPLGRGEFPDEADDARTVGALARPMLAKAGNPRAPAHVPLGELRPDLPQRLVEAVEALSLPRDEGGEPGDVRSFIAAIAMADAVLAGEVEAAHMEAMMIEQQRIEREQWNAELEAHEQRIADLEQKLRDERAEMERTMAEERERLANEREELLQAVATEREELRQATDKEREELRQATDKEREELRQATEQERETLRTEVATERAQLQREAEEARAALAGEREAFGAEMAAQRAELEQTTSTTQQELEQRAAAEREAIAAERRGVEEELARQRRESDERLAAQAVEMAAQREALEQEIAARREHFEQELESLHAQLDAELEQKEREYEARLATRDAVAGPAAAASLATGAAGLVTTDMDAPAPAPFNSAATPPTGPAVPVEPAIEAATEAADTRAPRADQPTEADLRAAADAHRIEVEQRARAEEAEVRRTAREARKARKRDKRGAHAAEREVTPAVVAAADTAADADADAASDAARPMQQWAAPGVQLPQARQGLVNPAFHLQPAGDDDEPAERDTAVTRWALPAAGIALVAIIFTSALGLGHHDDARVTVDSAAGSLAPRRTAPLTAPVTTDSLVTGTTPAPSSAGSTSEPRDRGGNARRSDGNPEPRAYAPRQEPSAPRGAGARESARSSERASAERSVDRAASGQQGGSASASTQAVSPEDSALAAVLKARADSVRRLPVGPPPSELPLASPVTRRTTTPASPLVPAPTAPRVDSSAPPPSAG